jgi:hypothetical protein
MSRGKKRRTKAAALSNKPAAQALKLAGKLAAQRRQALGTHYAAKYRTR